ncbi:MAG: hypothetical protein V1918_04960, partial [Planctomycetota bacterium]
MSKESYEPGKMRRLVRRIVRTYADDRGVNHLEGLPIPDRNAILRAVADLEFIIFPGFTDSRTVSHANVEYMVGDVLNNAYAALVREIETAYHYQCRLERCASCRC